MRAASALSGLVVLFVSAASPGEEHTHVLRSAAAALGAIGPAASEAIPALEALEKMPLVRWAAEAAIKKIRG